LAFDTIFQEGQRRYLESLSSYARQFLGGLKNQMPIRLKGYRQRLPLIKKQFLLIRAPQSAL